MIASALDDVATEPGMLAGPGTTRGAIVDRLHSLIGYIFQQRAATRSRERRWFVPFLVLGVGAVTVVELGLRLVPGVVPAAVLDRFPHELRQQVEVGQTLFRRHGLVDVPRDDGGPALRVPAPDAVVRRPQHPADREFDAVEAVATDDTGFCNPPPHRWSAEDAEIVALGDSFTWCFAVAPEEAWPAQLELLTGSPTYNLGRGGIGLFEALQILKVYGLPRHPEIVILNVFEGNDARDTFRYWQARRLTEPGAEHPPLPMAEKPGVIRQEPAADLWWKRLVHGAVRTAVHETPLGRSYLVNLGLGAYQAAVRSRSTAEDDFRYELGVNGCVVPFNAANNTRDLINARAVTEGHLPPSLLEPALASFAEISMEAGFRAMVTYTPAAYTAYEGLATFRADGVAGLMRRFSRTQREWLRDAARRYGLDYLDLTPFLQRAAAASTEPLYFPHNQHFTAAGHRVVAAAIAEALRHPAPSKALPTGTPSATAPTTMRGKRVATDSDPAPRPRPSDEVGTGPERSLGDVAAGDAIDLHPLRTATP